MPEFQPRKRRSMTDQELYEEYRGIKKTGKKTKKSSSSAKSASAAPKSNVSKRPSPAAKPSSANNSRIHRQEQKKTVPAKKSSRQKSDIYSHKKRGRFTLYYVLFGILIIAALSILSVTVLFNISTFEVIGESPYTDEEIISACGIEKGSNLLRVNIGKAEESIISELVYIDSATVSRGFPNRLIITVEEADPVAGFAYAGNYYIISAKGRLLEVSGSVPPCPTVMGFVPDSDAQIGAKLADDEEERVAAAVDIINAMISQGLTESCAIDLSDTMNITVTYDDRIEMQLGTSASLEDKFYHASLLIESEITPSEKCTLILTNPDRVVKRPIYDTDTDDEGYVVTEAEPEEPDEESEETQNDEENTEDE